MTILANTPPEFWTRVSRRYAERPISDAENYEATLARTLSYLKASDTVLELGAGTSSTAIRLAPAVQRYVSSDYAAGMVEIGRERAWSASVPGLQVVEGGLGDPALGAGPYDVVLALNLLHLLPDLRQALRQVAGLLPQGGLFISKTPCMGRQRWIMGPMIGAMRLVGKAPYVGLFTESTLEAKMEDAGFELIETGSYPAGGRMRYIVARRL